VCPKPSSRTVCRSAPSDRTNRSEHMTTAAAPSLICEQSLTFSGGATTGLLGDSVHADSSVSAASRVWALGLSLACSRLLKATRASCSSVRPYFAR
jgi:hypothetical protein